MSKRKEGKVEEYLVEQIEGIGGKCYKTKAEGVDGWPDRMVFVPHQDPREGCNLDFVECKTEEGKLRPSQIILHREFERLRVMVLMLNSKSAVDEYISFLISQGFGKRRIVVVQ